jgi:hypothetical protein
MMEMLVVCRCSLIELITLEVVILEGHGGGGGGQYGRNPLRGRQVLVIGMLTLLFRKQVKVEVSKLTCCDML